MATHRYAALLRGVSPMNANMADLRRCFEAGGFEQVKTVLSSGNVVFDARPAKETVLARQCERLMQAALPRSFSTIVRRVDRLQELLDSDPFAAFRLPAGAKKVVTFLPELQRPKLTLPISADGARILSCDGLHVYVAYVPSPRGAQFMTLIERTFGKDVTTRSWDTVRKVAAA